MKRCAFLLKTAPGRQQAAEETLRRLAPQIQAAARRDGIGNFSMWGVADLLCGYGEQAGDAAFEDPKALREALTSALGADAGTLCPAGSMRLMYHDIGVVREDKSLIRHRVFVTKLKPGCAEEYKRRHDGLIEARGDAVSQGPDSNFTIWYGRGYIFGYCEKVRSFDREMTAQEREATVAWETRQLEIMDWLTDDVDWITGETHEKIRRIV